MILDVIHDMQVFAQFTGKEITERLKTILEVITNSWKYEGLDAAM